MALFDYSKFNLYLQKERKIALFCHVNPDGDCLGSAYALKNFLEIRGHQVKIITPNASPEFYHWLPGMDEIIIHEKHTHESTTYINSCDLLISIDHNSPVRTASIEEVFRSSNAHKAMFDHHVNPDQNAYNYIFSLPGTSSTAEIIYDYIIDTAPSIFNKEMAIGIYVGILTDTGSFSYSADNAQTYRIIASLIEKGIKPKEIHQKIYGSIPEKRLRLLGFCISERLVVLKEHHTAYIWLSLADQEKFNYTNGDAEGVVNYALSLQGVKFAAFFKETKDKIRISFRSQFDFPANDFAKKHFLGGGHLNAAGGDSYDDLESSIKKFEQLIAGYAHSLN